MTAYIEEYSGFSCIENWAHNRQWNQKLSYLSCYLLKECITVAPKMYLKQNNMIWSLAATALYWLIVANSTILHNHSRHCLDSMNAFIFPLRSFDLNGWCCVVHKPNYTLTLMFFMLWGLQHLKRFVFKARSQLKCISIISIVKVVRRLRFDLGSGSSFVEFACSVFLPTS